MADKRFTIQLDAQMNISQVKNAVQSMQTELNKLNLPPEIGNKIGATLGNLSNEIERFQAKAAKGIGSTVDFTQISRSGEKIIQLYEQLRNQAGDLGGLSKAQLEKLFPPEAVANIKKANAAYETYTATVKKSSSELEKAQKSYKEISDSVDGLKQKINQLRNTKPVSDDTMSGWKKGLQESTKECENLQTQIDETKAKMQAFVGEEGKGRTESTARKSSRYRTWEKELQDLTERFNTAKAAQIDFQSKINTNITFAKQTNEIKKYESQLETAQGKLQSLSTTIASMGQGNTQAFETLIAALNQINGINLDPAKASIEDVQQAIDKLTNEQRDQLRQSFGQLNTIINNSGSTFDNLGAKIEETRVKVQQLDAKLSEINLLKSRVQYFFGLTNSVNLFRRAVTSAFQTVKELDAAMTETAVVTNFTVGDMWEKLPEYTKNASALGATTEELYKATTLYYQQGLKGNEVMAIGIETMKMARIAGMEAAEATEAMTAALRGFNMEVNETNAVRVNDVYSELAAITAADTEQIATAMTKTASIAANANMEFETTAALLAQIIETTQEAPETAGTAMKTIIARFSEVKKLQNRGEKTGKDSEGEEIDVNKIDKALKSVGISMDEFFAGTKGLDEVLLELAEKWDTLDFTTQRYIATTAAGSRQQSRFIAMMSDYGRTMELVDAANNSAGASQRQFEKTLDSMAAKMNKLSNAWDEFLMGLANNEFIKTGVDLLTGLLTTLNGIIDVLSFNGEIPWLKSLLTLGVVLGGLKGGKFLLNKGFNLAFGGLEAEKQNQEILLNKMKVAQENALHKQQLANQAREHAAELKAIQETKLAALTAEKEKRIAALRSEETEKIAAIGGEETEEAAAIHSEYTEKIAGIESEIAVQQAEIANDQVITQAELAATQAEQAAAVAGEEAEKTAALAGEGAETKAAVAGEGLETSAAVASETAEGVTSGIGGLFSKAWTGIGNFFKKNGKMIGTIASIIASIAMIGTAVDYFEQSIDAASQTAEEQLSSLQAVEEGLIEQTADLSNELSSLGEKRSNFNKMIKSLDNLNRGSAEWASTMHQIRGEMYDILETYPELIKHTEFVNGARVLTEDGWKVYEDLLTQTYYEQMLTLYGAKMQRVKAEDISAAENLQISTSSVTAEEEAKLQSGVKTGTIVGGALGAVGGGAAAAKIGAVLGTAIAPGIGTIIGTALGIAIGAGVGWLAGGGLTKDDGISPDILNKVALDASEATLERQGEKVTFSAMEATDEEIEAFVDSFDLNPEETKQLNDYIISNREEFDAHTVSLKESQQALYDFGRTLGAITAEEKGYSGETAEVYENIFSDTTQEVYDRVYSRIESQVANIDLTSSDIQKEIMAATGYTYDSHNNQYMIGDQPVGDFTEEEQRAALTSYRTMKEITNMADATFIRMTSSGMTKASVESALLTQDAKEIGQLSLQDVNQYVDGIIDKAVEGVSDYAVEGQQMIDQALSLEREGYDTGLYAHARVRQSSTNQAQVTTHGSLSVDKTLANAEDVYATWFSKEEKKIEGMSTDKIKFFAGEAENQEVVFNFAKTAIRDLDDNWEFSDYDYSGYYDAVHSKTGYSAEIIQAYQSEGVEGVKEEYGWNILYGEDGHEGLSQQAQAYADIMSFLETVALDTAIQFGQAIEGIKEVYDLGIYEENLKFESTINTIMKGVGEENQTMAANYMANLDFTNLTELRWFESWLQELPGASEEAIDAAGNLIDYLEKSGIAFADIDLEALINQLNSSQKLIKRISENEIGEQLLFSQEELDTLLQGGANREDFISTTEGFVYLGESMSELRETLMESNAILLGMQNDALRRKVEVGQFVSDSVALSEMSWGTTDTWTEDQINFAFDEMINQALVEYNDQNKKKDPNWVDLTTSQITADNWKAIVAGTPLESFGYDFAQEFINTDPEVDSRIEWNTETDEGTRNIIRTFFKEMGDSYLNLGTYEEQYGSGIRNIKESQLSLMTGQELVNAIGQTDKYGNIYTATDVDRVLAAQAQIEGTNIAGYELGEQIWASRQEEAKMVGQGAFVQTISDGGTDDEAKLARQQAMNEVYEESHRLGQALALDAARNQEEYTALSKVFADQTDTITEANRGTDAYRKGLSKVQRAMEDAYDIELTEQFMLDHAKLLEKVLAGEEGAWEEWAKLMAKQTTKGFNENESIISDTMKALALDVDNIANTIDPNIGITSTFDPAGIIAAKIGLQTVEEGVVATQAQLNGLASLYDILGATIEFETETKWLSGGALFDSNPGDGQEVQVVKAIHVTNTGSGNLSNYSPSGGGGGGGGGSEDWENPYDKLHNILEKINDLLREREKLERRYQRLVDQGTATAENLSKISKDNVSNYQDEIAKQEYVIAGRKAQVQAKIKANPEMEKYVYTDVDAMGNETIRIDWDAINAITDPEEGEKVSKFYDDIDEWLESIYDAEESILEAEDGIWEELQQGKDEYLDLEEQVKEAIVNERQEEIDKLSAINDSINDTNSRLLEAMQTSIDKYRQDRENQKTEEELSDKQRRLAYLQQDTSGANDLEIMKLQEEIDQGQQDYTDSLIDQKISELQEQNDKAAEQRQQQIDIMQAQLDKYVESGEIWKEVSDLIATGTDAAQNLVKGSELETLLKSSAGFEGMSNVQKMAWLQDTNVLIAQALKWLSDGAVSSFSTGQEVTFKTGDGKTITGKANAKGEIEADGQIYKDVSMDAYGNYSTKETVEDAKNEYTHRKEEKKKADKEAAFNARFPYGRPSDISRNLWWGHEGTDVKALQLALNELGFEAGEVDGVFGPQTWNALARFKSKYGGHDEYGLQSKTKAAFRAIEYKTGGLADFTGPAWLDGTRSKPEYILNADQTKAFFTLVDVLGSLQAGNSKTTQNSGDNTYDIDINVESIGSDYDVEQLAATVKRLINEDARYRNNNVINLMR